MRSLETLPIGDSALVPKLGSSIPRLRDHLGTRLGAKLRFARRGCLRAGAVLAGIAITALTTGCQTARPFATPDATWTSHIGQLKHTNDKRVLVGEVVVQHRGTEEFQLDYLKGGSFPLLSLRQDATGARGEGLLANGRWQGTPATAPKPLAPWLKLREAFVQKYPPGTKSAQASPSLRFSDDSQHFEFLFNR